MNKYTDNWIIPEYVFLDYQHLHTTYTISHTNSRIHWHSPTTHIKILQLRESYSLSTHTHSRACLKQETLSLPWQNRKQSVVAVHILCGWITNTNANQTIIHSAQPKSTKSNSYTHMQIVEYFHVSCISVSMCRWDNHNMIFIYVWVGRFVSYSYNHYCVFRCVEHTYFTWWHGMF